MPITRLLLRAGMANCLLLGLLFSHYQLVAQEVIVLESCGQNYIDPQDASSNPEQSKDTLTYTTYFDNDQQQRAFYIDINAFGGQQVDRTQAFAIMPDSSLKAMGELAFGNCTNCVQGFALKQDNELIVSGVNDRTEMDQWLQAQSQPLFELTGSLQTLAGVGRLSGTLPPCAIGLYVEYSVSSSAAGATTEFSTHILCPQVVQDCTIATEAAVNCAANEVFLEVYLPPGCYSENATVRWFNAAGASLDNASGTLPLAGNEGWFYLEIEDGCCQILDSLLVEVPVLAEAGADVTICENESVRLDGIGEENVFWEKPDGSTVEGAVLEILQAQAFQSGQYVFHSFNAQGCEGTDTLLLNVQVPPRPQLIIPNVCLGDTLEFLLTNDSLYANLLWQNPQGQQLAAPILPNLQTSDFGSYTLTAIDFFGCQTDTIFNVSGNAPPDFDYTLEEFCDSTNILLSPNSYRYEWQDGTAGTVFTTKTGGSFELQVTDSTGCTSTAMLEISPPDGPNVDIELTHPVCPGDATGRIEFVVENDNKPLIFSIDGGETYSVNRTFNNLWAGTYALEIQDGLGCIKRQTVDILKPDTLAVNLNYDRLDVRPTTPISLSANTIGNVTTYQWLPKEIDSGTANTAFEARTDMDVRIIVQDERGCLASDGFPLTIILPKIYIPNAFSPDKDGRNDYFTFFTEGNPDEVSLETLRIFDRWGGLLFETEKIELNQPNLGWDGHRNGKILDAGTYTYQGIVRFANGVEKEFSGDVLLLRMER